MPLKKILPGSVLWQQKGGYDLEGFVRVGAFDLLGRRASLVVCFVVFAVGHEWLAWHAAALGVLFSVRRQQLIIADTTYCSAVNSLHCQACPAGNGERKSLHHCSADWSFNVSIICRLL